MPISWDKSVNRERALMFIETFSCQICDNISIRVITRYWLITMILLFQDEGSNRYFLLSSPHCLVYSSMIPLAHSNSTFDRGNFIS